MGVEEQVRNLVVGALTDLAGSGVLPSEVTSVTFSVERPKRPEHGDLATNAALAVQKAAKKPPREIATLLAERLGKEPDIRAVEIAGPGFLNLRLAPAIYQRVLGDVTAAGPAFGRGPAGLGERVLVEFVSANPTGPLLISHGRGAILGDAVATLLEATGHRVTREYYINDFGNQIRLLAASVLAVALGREPPEGGYGKNDYLEDLVAWLQKTSPELIADDKVEELARVCVSRMLDGVPGSKALPGIKKTLASLRIQFDGWYSEESLHRWGRVNAALAELQTRGYLEEREGALFFKSTDEGDDKDRVVKKRDGYFTYFASDIAYHADKINRGYDRLVNVLGADHHGYTARVRGALAALGLPKERFEVVLYQLVNLLRDGKPYKMGKRLGNLVTIEEVVDEIDEAARRKGAGADALRYFYLARRSDTTIDLDIELAKKASMDNPVFYLQYGYARLCSILRRAQEKFGLQVPRHTPALAARLEHPDELAILGRLGRFPAIVAEASALREPHRILFYLQELSQDFQSYFTRLKKDGDTILPLDAQMAEAGWQETWDRPKSEARLLWIEAIRTVYGAGLKLAGITALERMHKLEGEAVAAEAELGFGAEDAEGDPQPQASKKEAEAS
ncbi:arginine--tRNA ligase [Polyangium sorediatum]|uniref:Arginine--tRNA ligase n=1 Tax=Polyangium sorediatum TaxID=889274 RepID=A0ABT6P3T4_9BACT|nr:arginine--tRNA ligase [Polyangium sorediatum]MDI1435218.1 arginine--tRNA ligase [Polyangium sorediatum]